jgi:O-acetyl-ADP-ribose deacetylase
MLTSRISLVRADITTLAVDAIVNAANSDLRAGGAVGLAIHRAAGPEPEAECLRHPGCRPGEAAITGAYRLPARYVIHAVGASWHGGKRREAVELAGAYRSSFAPAREHGVRTIAFPAISCGLYGYPAPAAAHIAIRETVTALRENPSLDRVFFALVTDEVWEAFQAALALEQEADVQPADR